MNPDFYVIVIDDKKEVCQRIEGKITGGPSLGAVDPIVPVRVKSIHVSLSEIGKTQNPVDSKWSFSDKLCGALIEAASSKPDLIIVDYVYVDSNVAMVLKELAKHGEFNEKLMIDRALTPSDLRKWIETTEKISDSNRRKIINNLLDVSCPIYLHTYTPQGISPVVGSVNERVRKIRQVFPNGTITSIDTRSELFNGDEFDWPNPNSRFDGQYYPYQLAVFFDQVVQKEILRKELSKNRYLRIKRTTFSVGVITAIGASVGFAAGWVGDVLIGLVHQHQYTEAFIIGSGLLVLLLVAGGIMPFLFEKWMQKVMHQEELTNG